MNERCGLRALIFMLLSLLSFTPNPAFTADHSNLESGFPTTIEDAYPIAYRALELQLGAEYEHEGEDGTHAGGIDPEFKWGFMKNAHVALGVPLEFREDGDMENNGDIELEGLYNFNVEAPALPAFAVQAGVILPTGVDSGGVDFSVTGIATRGWGPHRFHLNAGYERNDEPDSEERQDLYSFGLGYDHPIDLDHLFVADFFIDRAKQKGGDPLLTFSLGVRKQVNPWSVVALGVGGGFGDDAAPDFKLNLGYQLGF